MKLNKYILEIVVFVCGGVVMIFELIGSRILGPYFGTSIFIWTSLIGIILGSLSAGYYFGGKIADRKASFANLSLIILLAAIFMGTTLIIKEYLLKFLQFNIADVKLSSILAALILFSPVSFLLGIVSPYAVKLKLSDLNESGKTIGNLYALSTLGSISGTFLSGYFLIPYFGTNKLLILLIAVLVFISFIISMKYFVRLKLIFFLIISIGWLINNAAASLSEKKGFIDVDTAYNRIWIYDYNDSETNKMVKMMGINNENHSSMFLDSDELVNACEKYYNVAEYFNSNIEKALMLGGAAYSYPKYFLTKYPSASIDVVEIDPMLTQLAKKYFKLTDDPRLNIYHEDGRVYLNKTKSTYDAIFTDAFGSRYSVPYQLTTKEAVQKFHDILSDDGVIISNIISSVDGESGQFLRAEYATYKSIFPTVYLFPVLESTSGELVQNIMLVALKSKNKQQKITKGDNGKYDSYLNHMWSGNIASDMPILSDDFAPVDYYINKLGVN